LIGAGDQQVRLDSSICQVDLGELTGIQREQVSITRNHASPGRGVDWSSPLQASIFETHSDALLRSHKHYHLVIRAGHVFCLMRVFGPQSLTAANVDAVQLS
jgi:hypothetical protein